MRNGAKPHEFPGHFLEILLDRLSDELTRSNAVEEEVTGIVSAFAEMMDEASVEVGRGLHGRNEIWRLASSITQRLDVARFEELLNSAKSINWLAHVMRSYVGSTNDIVDSKARWINEYNREKIIDTAINRFKSVGAEAIFDCPAPLDILYFWLTLGKHDEVGAFVKDAISTDAMFLKVLGALRTWATSSDRGTYRSLRRGVISDFMNPDEAKIRLQQLAEPDAEPTLRLCATQLLDEYTEEFVISEMFAQFAAARAASTVSA